MCAPGAKCTGPVCSKEQHHRAGSVQGYSLERCPACTFFNSEAIFETGVGESTKIAIFTGVPRYTGVDNAVAWLGNVMKNAPSHYRFHWADIGAIKRYSHPTDMKARPKWPLASMAALAAEEEPFDFYLVDGRFRVASIAASMLHAMMGGKRDALFGIHDYKTRRAQYGRVEDIGIIVRGAGAGAGIDGIDASAKLAVLKMKPGLTAAEIVAVYRDFQYNER